jgi:DHA3 family macrolide efflux protein-like MFS transporter
VISRLLPPRALAVVAGQAGAALGFGVTGFALGTWALSRTHESAAYTMLVSASALPGVLVAPIAGAVAERFSPSRVLVLANLCALVSTLALLGLVVADVPPGLHLPALLVLSGLGFGLQWPAWGKAMTALVSSTQLSTAAALLQFGTVAQYVLAPAVAGALVGVLGTAGLLGLDAALLVLAIVTALLAPTTAVSSSTGGIVDGVLEAWAFLRARPALLTLQLFFFCSYFFGGVSVSLSTPLVLSMTDARTAGLCLSLSGAGMLVGVVVAIVLSLRRSRAMVVLGLEGLCGLALLGMGLSSGLVGVTGWSMAFLVGTAVSNAASQALWQEAVPLVLQVRVFALRRMLAWGALPVGYLVAGHAADLVGRVLADRRAGIAAIFIVAGLGKALVSLAFARSRVRLLDVA